MDECRQKIAPQPAKETKAEHRRRITLIQAFEQVMERLAQPYPDVSFASLPTTLQYLAYDEDADDLPDEMREVVAELVHFERSFKAIIPYIGLTPI